MSTELPSAMVKIVVVLLMKGTRICQILDESKQSGLFGQLDYEKISVKAYQSIEQNQTVNVFVLKKKVTGIKQKVD